MSISSKACVRYRVIRVHERESEASTLYTTPVVRLLLCLMAMAGRSSGSGFVERRKPHPEAVWIW